MEMRRLLLLFLLQVLSPLADAFLGGVSKSRGFSCTSSSSSRIVWSSSSDTSSADSAIATSTTSTTTPTTPHEPTRDDLLQTLLQDASLSDVTFMCNDKTKIHANKCLLAAKSPVFRALLYNNNNNNNNNKPKKATTTRRKNATNTTSTTTTTNNSNANDNNNNNQPVPIIYSGPVVAALMEYIYTDQLSLLSLSSSSSQTHTPETIRTLVSLLDASVQFELPLLSQQITHALPQLCRQQPVLAPALLRYAPPNTFQPAALNVIRNNLDLIVHHPVAMASLGDDPAVLECILQDRELVATETQVFQLILQWYSVHPNNHPQRKTAATQLVQAHIHLEQMDATSLARMVAPSGLVDAERLLEAFTQQALLMNDNVSTPQSTTTTVPPSHHSTTNNNNSNNNNNNMNHAPPPPRQPVGVNPLLISPPVPPPSPIVTTTPPSTTTTTTRNQSTPNTVTPRRPSRVQQQQQQQQPPLSTTTTQPLPVWKVPHGTTTFTSTSVDRQVTLLDCPAMTKGGLYSWTIHILQDANCLLMGVVRLNSNENGGGRLYSYHGGPAHSTHSDGVWSIHCSDEQSFSLDPLFGSGAKVTFVLDLRYNTAGTLTAAVGRGHPSVELHSDLLNNHNDNDVPCCYWPAIMVKRPGRVQLLDYSCAVPADVGVP